MCIVDSGKLGPCKMDVDGTSRKVFKLVTGLNNVTLKPFHRLRWLRFRCLGIRKVSETSYPTLLRLNRIISSDILNLSQV